MTYIAAGILSFIAAVPGWWWDKLDDDGRKEMVSVHAAGIFFDHNQGCKKAHIRVERVIAGGSDQVWFLGECEDGEKAPSEMSAWNMVKAGS